ncbi:hypothetical protein MHB40_14535 [Lysinibacillus sp. FSL K6-0057]|uniref:hypothetical protein n=1 Tax=Lysinibacillus sp. FSL K6-0057 TaxID=2921411 RepID=UPI00315A60F4
MNITLTDEQFKEIKEELISELKGNYKTFLTEILENEYDIYDEITNTIESKLEEGIIYENLDKILDKLDKQTVINSITNSLMEKLTRW